MVESAAPYRNSRGGDGGCQIDLLIQTPRTAYVVEVKRKREIGREIVAELSEKCERLSRRPGVSLRTALVYDGELAPSVEADGYIDSIIPARRLLGL